MPAVRLFIALAIAGSVVIDAEAQSQPKRPFVENGFVSFNAAGVFGPPELSDRVQFEANAEAGTLDADYSAGASAGVDAAAGLLVHRRIGVGLGISHANRSGSVSVRARVPHPFFDDRHRAVEGDANDIHRRETDVHAQIYYELPHRGPWRVRFFAGPSYVRVEQDLITGVETQEAFPFDTAEFRRAATERAKGSGIGVNAGLDLSRMISRRAGLGAVVRYAGASVDLNAGDGRDVSTNTRGLTAGLGLRVAF